MNCKNASISSSSILRTDCHLILLGHPTIPYHTIPSPPYPYLPSPTQDIPSGIPTTTTHLILADNQITRISALGLFNRIPNLAVLDMSRNKIVEIEQGAFEGAYSINEM